MVALGLNLRGENSSQGSKIPYDTVVRAMEADGSFHVSILATYSGLMLLVKRLTH